jgi:hypothetical protein
MKVVHYDEVQEAAGSTHRQGALKRKRLIEGDDARPVDNFSLTISRTAARYSPRHRHNFEQFRFQIDGEANYSRTGKLKKGMLGYFPESAFYGPQEESGDLTTLVLQFAGASGNGYPGRSVTLRMTEELKKFGTFEKGVFFPNEGSGMKRKDGFQAIWEHYNQRPLVYEKARYEEPILMDPAGFAWIGVKDAPGVFEKLMGVFTERHCVARFLKLDSGAEFTVDGKRDLYVVLTGAGTVDGEPYQLWTAVFADWDDRIRFAATEPTELINLRLPDLRDHPAAGHSERPVIEAAE